jgi:hypothetical protein
MKAKRRVAVSFLLMALNCFVDSAPVLADGAPTGEPNEPDLAPAPLDLKRADPMPSLPVEALRAESNGFLSASVPQPWIVYSSVECSVVWNQDGCTGSIPIDAPHGWQICQLLYNQVKKDGNVASSWSADHWTSSDPIQPVGFQRYNLVLTAHGSRRPPRRGAIIRWENVGVSILPIGADFSARLTCDVPLGPPD